MSAAAGPDGAAELAAPAEVAEPDELDGGGLAAADDAAWTDGLADAGRAVCRGSALPAPCALGRKRYQPSPASARTITTKAACRWMGVSSIAASATSAARSAAARRERAPAAARCPGRRTVSPFRARRAGRPQQSRLRTVVLRRTAQAAARPGAGLGPPDGRRRSRRGGPTAAL